MGGSEIDRALARAVLCRTLQRGLMPPRPAAPDGLADAAGMLARHEAVLLLDRRDGEAAAAVKALEKAGAAAPEDMRRRHESIFGHTLRGSVCPYETEHGSDALFQQGQEMADIAGYYLAFGLSLPEAGAERVDHIACEFEFLQLLALKEAYALEVQDEEMLEVTRDAWRSFFRDHLGRFGRAFGAGLARADEGGYHGALGRLCSAFVDLECRRLGLPRGPDLLPLRPADDGVPMACGSGCGGDDLLQIESPGPPEGRTAA